jgi:uncharacterized protein YraI
MVGLRTAIVAGFATTALLLAPALAQAAEGVVVETTSLFAGPDSQFPPVDQVPAGTSVQVNGCLTGYTWCDVSFQNDRGWISGQALEILYQSRRVRVVEITPDIVIVPFVSFEFHTYWDEHYRDRPFYGERDRYASININVNVTGDKGGPDHKGSKTETGKVSGIGAAGTMGGGKPPNGNVGGKGKVVTHKIVTKDNNGAGAGAMSAGKGAGAAVVKKGATPTVVKKGPAVVKKVCKPGEKDCGKGQGNGN